MKLQAITNEQGNYLVGFHDIDPWSSDGNRFLAIRVDSLLDIPSNDSYAEIVTVDLSTGAVQVLDKTTCWNFPQGGRQCWVRNEDSDLVIFNIVQDNKFTAKIVDTDGQLVHFCDKPTNCISPCQKYSYGLNYERMYRLGGYGYPGVKDTSEGIHKPKDDGIWKTDLDSGKSELILSLYDITMLKGNSAVLEETDHYVTHILPSPNGSKICFLHRYWLPDGGIQTRLIISDSDGHNAGVWDEGFMSHFDWIDDESILIWGKPVSKAQSLRSSSSLQTIPFLPTMLQMIKPIARKVLGKKIIPQGFYKVVSKNNKFSTTKFSEKLPVGDGHPSFSPLNRDLLLTDTYPNEKWERELLILDCKSDELHNLGKLAQCSLAPSDKNYGSILSYTDKNMMSKFSKKHFVYSRSGIHCDFHPRWKSDGSYFAIDSNHEGRRNVYIVDVNKEINA
ncbi:hypothetical protein ACFOEW_00240 [Alteromonas oceani]|uniref:Oligogalacturonate lyase domain-containing protein n=1 Tax=Alteromonas oceani TaxID=2071609 RepID=A0ABV7JTY8_9ALTE|nr:hypothetical protein [Alteromonas oceani]